MDFFQRLLLRLCNFAHSSMMKSKNYGPKDKSKFPLQESLSKNADGGIAISRVFSSLISFHLISFQLFTFCYYCLNINMIDKTIWFSASNYTTQSLYFDSLFFHTFYCFVYNIFIFCAHSSFCCSTHRTHTLTHSSSPFITHSVM